MQTIKNFTCLFVVFILLTGCASPAPEMDKSNEVNITDSSEVVESTPTSEMQLPSQEFTPHPEAKFVLERAVETDTGYILTGNFDSDGLSPELRSSFAVVSYDHFRIVDIDGEEISYQVVDELDSVKTERSLYQWAFQIEGKNHKWPLKILFDDVYLEFSTNTGFVVFDFDVGEKPKIGQKWQPGIDIQIGDYALRLVSIYFTGNGYLIKYRSDFQPTNGLVKAGGEIMGHPSSQFFTRNIDGQGGFTWDIHYSNDPPVGPLRIRIYTATIWIQGPWALEWQPEKGAVENLSASTLTPDLSDDTAPPWVGTPSSGNPPSSEKPLPEGVKNGDIVIGRDNLFYLIWENTKSRIWFPATVDEEELRSIPDGPDSDRRIVGQPQPNDGLGHLVVTMKGEIYWLDTVRNTKYRLRTVTLSYDELNSIPTAFGEQYFPVYLRSTP